MGKKEWNVDQLLQISGIYWQTCTLHSAVKLDLFTILGDQNLTASEIAKKLEGDERGVTMLLNALAAMRLLTQSGSLYSNTPASRLFLSKDKKGYIGHIILHHQNLVEAWSRLDQAVKTGKPVRRRMIQAEEEERENFLMGMFNLAMNIAPRVAEVLDLSGRKHLLDLGGGPGTYAIHFCKANPGMTATVFDLPATRPFAEKTIQQFGLGERIDFQAGNFLENEIKGAFDVVWLSHILHGEGPSNCRKLIQKAVSALEPGGMIIIHEFILDNSMAAPLFPALFALNMLAGTKDGQAYSEQQLMDMLEEAGVKQIRRHSFRGPNDAGIVYGIREPTA